MKGRTHIAIALLLIASGSARAADCEGLFDSRQVLNLDIAMDPAEWDSVRKHSETRGFHAARLTCESGTPRAVGIRRAPGVGATDRTALEIAVDHVVQGRTLEGETTFALFAGTRAPEAASHGKDRSFVNVQVNGTFVGLYTLVPGTARSSPPPPATPLRRSEKIGGVPPGGPLVLINEVLANTPGGNDVEFIELYNAGTAAQDLSGWYLLDSDDLHDRCVLEGTLEPGQYLVVPGFTDLFTARYPGVTALNPHQCDSAESGAGFGLGNGDDQVRLFRETASVPELVDILTYGRQGVDVSFGYRPFDADAAEYLATPTPGTSNDASQLHSSVCINEFQTTSLAGGVDDWVELFNRGDTTVDISGWFLTDNVNDPLRYVFPAGSILAAGAFLTVDETALGFSFSSTGSEPVLLTRSDGTTGQDYYDFGPQFADVAQGRFPDGSPNWHYFVDPSRGDSNTCDAGPTPPATVSGLVFTSPTELQWSPGTGADAYDVISGDLASLRLAQGDFSAAVSECAANNLTTLAAYVDNMPTQGGEGSFYLTRGVHFACGFGSYDPALAALVESRDTGILASAHACP